MAGPDIPHDTAPITLPDGTARRIAAYGRQGAEPVAPDAVHNPVRSDEISRYERTFRPFRPTRAGPYATPRGSA